MNIQIQTYGMIILFMLFIFYRSHKTLKLYTEQVFIRAMYISMINLMLDIFSLIFIANMDSLPLLVVKLVCKLYIISLVWESVFALAYVLTDVYSEEIHRKRTGLLYIIAGVQSLLVFSLPINIFVDDSTSYTYGPSVLLVYFFAVFYILAILLLCIFNKKLSRRRSFAVILWMCIWLAAAGIQFLFNNLLLVGFATAVGILILFVIMENPEANLDRKLGCFNSYALGEYLRRIYSRKTDFSIMKLYLSDVLDEKLGSRSDEILLELVSLIAKQKEVYVFRNVDSDITVISDNAVGLKDLAEQSVKLLTKKDIPLKKLASVIVPKGQDFSTPEELMSFLGYISDRYSDGTIIVADEQLINKYREKKLVQQEITAALDEDRVEVFLQPIFSNIERRFTSAEALVRIRQRDGSMLSPGVFIPVAEESGLIVELGDRIFEKVCIFLKEPVVAESGIHYVEINLSVVQFERADLADRLIELTEKHGIAPQLINLEITETASVTARNILLHNMNRLIEYGFTFSLDDFGKGESNLMYVVEMPVSIIKLDYDMSKAFFNSDKAKQVVHAVVGMAHGMDLKLVAEGIETKTEIDAMADAQIDYIQGYYYSRPLPMPEFMEFIRKHTAAEQLSAR
ncbi:MAG: EAL domain-containing protein [Ruminococcaceae bacterium]|nr:EAL domain-containing protein [Oscillospiraceae bacterium]